MAAENGKEETRTFFKQGSDSEWDFVYSVYQDALTLKAQQKRKPEELLKLDSWYQEELPKLIQSRKEKHVTHDELVQTMKWKLSRGKFYPQLTNLVRINTPLAVTQASRKAFKKLPNLSTAIQSLTNLKGVGPAMASAVLAAGAPEYAPFMADECLLALPNVDSIDYTVQEYMNFAQQVQNVVQRLNKNSKVKWTPHRVELALWAHYVISENKPSLLEKMPAQEDGSPNPQNGNSENQDEEENSKTTTKGEEENGDTPPSKKPEDGNENHQSDDGNENHQSDDSNENHQSEDTSDSSNAPVPDDSPDDDEPELKKAKTSD